jgi:hypothetical protein
LSSTDSGGLPMQTAIVRHILVKDKDLAEQLKKKILSGADFSKIAKQYSTCNSAKRGGELGEVKKVNLFPLLINSYLLRLNEFYMVQSKASLVFICLKSNLELNLHKLHRE